MFTPKLVVVLGPSQFGALELDQGGVTGVQIQVKEQRRRALFLSEAHPPTVAFQGCDTFIFMSLHSSSDTHARTYACTHARMHARTHAQTSAYLLNRDHDINTLRRVHFSTVKP